MVPALHKSNPSRLRKLTVRHSGSGIMKSVTYLGMGRDDDEDEEEGRRSPGRLHAVVNWPLSGDYEIDPDTGALLGLRRQNELGQGWKLVDEDHAFVKEQRQLEIERRKLVAREAEAVRKEA